MSRRAVDQRELGVRQRGRRTTQPDREPTNLADAALYQEYLRARTWLSVPQVMAYMDFPSEAAVREWASRNPSLRKGRRGRTLVFKRTALDQHIQQAVK